MIVCLVKYRAFRRSEAEAGSSRQDLFGKKLGFFSGNDLSFLFAAGPGFEPRLPRPERGVLPLDDPAIPFHFTLFL